MSFIFLKQAKHIVCLDMGDTPDKDNVTYSLDKLFCMTNKYFHKKVRKKKKKKFTTRSTCCTTATSHGLPGLMELELFLRKTGKVSECSFIILSFISFFSSQLPTLNERHAPNHSQHLHTGIFHLSQSYTFGIL